LQRFATFFLLQILSSMAQNVSVI